MTSFRVGAPLPDIGAEFVRQLMARSPDVFWITNPESGAVVYVSPACLDLWGIPQEAITSKKWAWLDSVHPDDRARVAHAVEALHNGAEYAAVYRIIRPDRSERWVRGRGFPLRDAADKITYVAGFAEDITAAHGQEEYSQILASAVEQSADALVVITPGFRDLGLRPVFVNPAYTRLTGYTSEEALALPLGTLFGAAPDLFAGGGRVREALEGGSPFSAEFVNYRKDGAQILVEWNVAPVKVRDGRPTHFVITLRDITAERRAQRELVEAKALAETADHAKSAFLASMSHELRTPLNAIIGFSELLEEGVGGELTERQRRFARNVLSAGRDLLALIDQILDLTRADVGLMSLHLSRFRVGDVLRDLQTLIRALADRRRLVLRFDLADHLPPIQADARKLKQILFSLLSNAIRVTPEKGEFAVSCRCLTEAGGEHLEVVITRSGESDLLPAEDVPTELPAYGMDHPLSGLGLALCRKLIELHGGTLVTELTPPSGERLRLLLPLGSSRAPQAVRPVAGLEAATMAPLVLIVEDNLEASDLLAHYLLADGYAVARAYTGEDAIRWAGELRPAVMTVDSELPDVHGLDVLAALRALPATRDIPAVVVSVTERRGAELPLGVAAWMVKPVDRQDLLRVLRAAIGSAQTAPAAPVTEGAP
ncbi:MAG: PAS domain S-box protein [Gemmatimonadales bacterium]|nr:PAS domain S-box protein [Gemmatimonadales bacterium]